MATSKATCATKGASAKPAPRTPLNSTRKVNKSPAQASGSAALRLAVAERSNPPFIVTSGGKYVSSDDLTGGKLASALRDAHRYPSQLQATEAAEALTAAHYPQSWSDPFTVAQMVANAKGIVTRTTNQLPKLLQPLQMALPPGILERGLELEAEEYAHTKLDPREVHFLCGLPRYAEIAAAHAAKLAAPSEHPRAVLDAAHDLRMFRAGYMAADEDAEEMRAEMAWEETPRMHDLRSVHVRPKALGAAHGSLLRSMVLAFCSHELKPYGYTGDVHPMPHQSNRAGNDLMFQVGTDELTHPTASAWAFKKTDWLEVVIDNKLQWSHGDLVVALVNADLTLLELRSKDGEDCDEATFAVELRQGRTLDRSEYLIIGRVRQFRRKYWGPDTESSRELKASIAEAIAAQDSVKGGAR